MTGDLTENRSESHTSFGVRVRPSRDGDVNAMLSIYLRHIGKGVDINGGLFDAPQVEDLKRRRKIMGAHKLPHLVAELAGEVIGYAYAVPFRKRPAYRYVVKHSIYIGQDHLHKGVGRLLLPALVDACAGAGYRQMIGYIDAANTASLRLHQSFGFRQAGYLAAVGFKFGDWTDTIIMQRSLGEGSSTLPGRLS
jgi:L-amino acid N-acyltransferase YncA